MTIVVYGMPAPQSFATICLFAVCPVLAFGVCLTVPFVSLWLAKINAKLCAMPSCFPMLAPAAGHPLVLPTATRHGMATMKSSSVSFRSNGSKEHDYDDCPKHA